MIEDSIHWMLSLGVVTFLNAYPVWGNHGELLLFLDLDIPKLPVGLLPYGFWFPEVALFLDHQLVSMSKSNGI